jgi:hypothetical protein
VRDRKGNVVPSQLTHDGLLIFQSGLERRGSSDFTITAGEPREFEARTYGRFVPERRDDFAWENDRVAFRIYGPALLPFDGPSNGIDIWYKRTERLVIDRWYADELSGRSSYHTDTGEGMDDYKVGRTLGAGTMAPYAGGRLWLNDNFRSWEILDNGPLRTTFRVEHPDLVVINDTITDRRTFTLDAGSQFTRVEQEFGFANPATVAAGFPLRTSEGRDGITQGENWLVLREPDTRASSGIWLGLIIPDGMSDVVMNEYDIPEGKQRGHYEHVLMMSTYTPGKPFTYYTGFGWAEHGFPAADDFEQHTRNRLHAIQAPLVVRIDN